ncbi:hypothetical protein Pelo_5908 [Pelomyxa schiedti]|nr:hypothetical protein Pelo_5908 [Pelomyxa schiedti]
MDTLAATFSQRPELFARLRNWAEWLVDNRSEAEWEAVAVEWAKAAGRSQQTTAEAQVQRDLWAIFNQRSKHSYTRQLFLHSLSELQSLKPRLARVILALSYIMKYEAPEIRVDIDTNTTLTPSTTATTSTTATSTPAAVLIAPISSSLLPLDLSATADSSLGSAEPELGTTLFHKTWGTTETTCDSYWAHKLKLEDINNLSAKNWPQRDRLAMEKLLQNSNVTYEIYGEDNGQACERLGWSLGWPVITCTLLEPNDVTLSELKSKYLDGKPYLFCLHCSQKDCDKLPDICQIFKQINSNLRIVLIGLEPIALEKAGLPYGFCYSLDMSLTYQSVLATLAYLFGEGSLFFGTHHQVQEIEKLATKLVGSRELLKKFLEIVYNDYTKKTFKSISDCLRKAYDNMCNPHQSTMRIEKKYLQKCLDIAWGASRCMQKSSESAIVSVLIPRNTEGFFFSFPYNHQQITIKS